MGRTFAIGAAGAALAVGAAGLAAAQTESLDLPGFDGVDVSAGQTVIFSQGPTQSISVEMIRGELSDMKIEVEDGDLVVRPKSRSWGRKGPRAAVTVVAPALSRIEASSGSSFEGDFTGERVSVDLSSGATVTLSGACEAIDIDSSSGSSLSAKGFECKRATVEASSGSSVSAFASDSVSADGSSGSSIKVYGGAKDVNSDKSSGASVSIES